jgi:hypothetical protein
MECFENLDDAISDLKKDFEKIFDRTYGKGNFCLINLIDLVECSKTLASLYLSKGSIFEKNKYDSIGDSALTALNNNYN